MKTGSTVEIYFHTTFQKHFLFLFRKVHLCCVGGPTPLQLYLDVCEKTICSSSQEAGTRIVGVPPQGPITASDAKVSWCDAWLKANDKEHFIFQSVLFLRSKQTLLIAFLFPTAYTHSMRSRGPRKQGRVSIYPLLYLFFHQFDKNILMPARNQMGFMVLQKCCAQGRWDLQGVHISKVKMVIKYF